MAVSVPVVLAGANGYGAKYAEYAFAPSPNIAATPKLVAVVEPAPIEPKLAAEIAERGIPVFQDFDAYLRSGVEAKAIFIATPPHTHAEIAAAALDAGMDVLCEKPLAASIADVAEIAAAEKRNGGKVAVGFQWSHEPSIIRMKRDILSGRLGAPKRLATLAAHPRSALYYAQAPSWRGRIATEDGRVVRDSPVGNALAHYLHHMLYIIGDDEASGADIAEVVSETYRAKDIENFDTCAMRCRTGSGVEVLFLATHSTERYRGPICKFEFENATITFDYDADPTAFQMVLGDGIRESYGPVEHDSTRKIDMFLEAVAFDAPLPCGIRAATPHVQCVEAIQTDGAGITSFPADLLRTRADEWDGGELTYVAGLDAIFAECFEQWKLPSELGLTE